MKLYIFVDNFRGFTNTCIPLRDVNFLVGENSTGKSSVLGLLKLFSGHRFMLNQDFADDDVGFNHFSDMVSANSADQSYFRVGFVSEVDPDEKKGAADETIPTGCLYTFKEVQGQGRLAKCTFGRGNEEVSLRFGKYVSFKTRERVAAATPQEAINRLRSEWVNEHCETDAGYEKLEVPANRKLPLFITLGIAIAASKDKIKKGKKEFDINPWHSGFSPPELTWFGPIRTKPRRTYDEWSSEFSPEGRHTPYLIRRMLNSKSEATKLKEFFEKVGKASGLFQDVRTKSFGRGARARFELDIVLDGKALNILDVGYGVSQSLPIIVELLAREEETWFAIQEPEIHLHPRAQAALGDVLFEMAARDRKSFLVETHSDYAIDRFRMNYRNGRSHKPDAQILFFERKDKHNVITPLAIGKTGELPVDQPESYRQFFVREQLNLLGI